MLTGIVHEEFLKIWTACREDNFVTFDTLAGLICEKKKGKSIGFESFLLKNLNIDYDFYNLQDLPVGNLGQWDILLLNLTFIGFTNFFRCLSFCTKADVVTIKYI